MFKLIIETKNDAFKNELAIEEIARILHELSKEMVCINRKRGKIFDINGNNVGTWQLR